MKHIFLLVLLSTSFVHLIAQDAAPIVNTDYLKKSKGQKTTGFVLLTTGFVCTGIGLITGAKSVVGMIVPGSDNNDNSTAASILIYGGMAMMATSIPFFIAASKNKKKAVSVSFRNQLILQPGKTDLTYTAIPSLSFKISFP